MTAALALDNPVPINTPRDAAVWACLDDLAAADAVREAVLPRAGAPLLTDGGIDAAFDRLEQISPPKVLIVGIAASSDPAGDIGALAQRCGPATRIVALGTINDVSLYRALTGAGAADYLVLPASAEALGAALDEVSHSPPATADTNDSETDIIAITGAVSGAGASTLAINAAWHLAAECGRRVALIDLDAQFGRAALSLDLEPCHGMREIFENPERIDSLFIAGALMPARAGLWVLGAEEPLESPLTVTAEAVERLVVEVAQTAEAIDTVILDVPRAVAAADPDVLRCARTTAVATELSLAGIRDTVRLCGRIAEIQDNGAIEIVACKIADHGKGEIGISEFERGTGRKVAHTLPWDPKSLALAGRDGKALAEVAAGAPLARAIARTAERLAKAGTAPSSAGRLFGWMKHAVGKS